MNERLEKKTQNALRGFIALFAIFSILIVIILASKAVKSNDLKSKVFVLTNDWLYQSQNQVFPTKVDTKLDIPVEDSLRIWRYVDAPLLQTRTLIFNSVGVDVEVFLNQKKVYSYDNNDSKIWYSGWKWNVVDLPHDISPGDNLSIVFRYERANEFGNLPMMYSAEVVDFFDLVLRDSIFSMITCALLLVLSMGIISLWFIRKSWKRNSYELLNIGLFAFLAAVSFSMRITWTGWVFNDGILLSVLTTYTSLLMILPLLLLCSQMVQTNHIKLFRILLFFKMIFITSRVVLELMGYGNWFIIYPIDLFVMILMGLAMIWALVDDYHRTDNRDIFRLMLPLFAMYVAMMIDLVIVKSGHYFYSVNLFSFLLILGIVYVTNNAAGNLASIYKESIDAQKYQILFETDILTGLKNRNCYSRRIEALTDLSNLCVIIMDVNNLKKINDTYGHQEGDRMIVDVSKMIVEAFGTSGYELFRIGGDEFAIFAFNKHSKQIEDDLWNFESKIRHLNVKRAYKVSVATGYAIYEPKRDANIDSLINRADQNMYFKKITNKL
ncbi:MAG: GGDEF domain-containing protein [Peptostreptococcaceae bacterium]|nr:GGDEF domain-containing protein [Peptostreptococcaceae bacterium]